MLLFCRRRSAKYPKMEHEDAIEGIPVSPWVCPCPTGSYKCLVRTWLVYQDAISSCVVVQNCRQQPESGVEESPVPSSQVQVSSRAHEQPLIVGSAWQPSVVTTAVRVCTGIAALLRNGSGGHQITIAHQPKTVIKTEKPVPNLHGICQVVCLVGKHVRQFCSKVQHFHYGDGVLEFRGLTVSPPESTTGVVPSILPCPVVQGQGTIQPFLILHTIMTQNYMLCSNLCQHNSPMPIAILILPSCMFTLLHLAIRRHKNARKC